MPLSVCRKSIIFVERVQASHRVPSSADDGIKSNQVISDGMYVGNYSDQPANVRAQRVRCRGGHPLRKKCAAFLRERVEFLDTLREASARMPLSF